MRLDELFGGGDLSVTDALQQSAIDILTPLLASKVPFVTVQAVIDKLQQLKSGIMIDRGMVMKLLDPNKVKSVSKIEGDKIYLQTPSQDDVEGSKENEESQIDKIKKTAISKAQADVKDKPEKPKAEKPKAPKVTAKPTSSLEV